ncbi:MFS transporter [Leifsonia sp. NPDC077715]|uniref:MFS transporter n=1 Tax=Leifsonia sp. NPDC077715 TaxID=3155539 RepID=UPI00343AD613
MIYLVWGGQSVSVLLSGATSISLSLWVYHLTGSAVSLATVAAVRLSISIYLSPVAGALADVVRRKTLILIANVGQAASALVLMMLTASSPDGASVISLTCVVLGASGVLDSVLIASLAASVRDIRSERNLNRASAIVSALDTCPQVIAPFLGAILYETWGMTPVLFVDALSFVVAGCAVAVVRWPDDRRSRASQGSGRSWSPFRGAAAGLRMIWSHRDYRRLQAGNAVTNLANGLAQTAVSVLLITGADGVGHALGLYNSSAALGLLIGSLIVAVIGARLRRSWSIGGGMVLAGIGGRAALGLTSLAPVWVVSGFVRSIGLQLNNIALTAIWQEATPRADQGKVFGARRLLGQGGYPVAVLVGGAVVDIIGRGGLGAWLIVLGCLETAVAAVLAASGVLGRIGGVATPALVE